jgi:hypothetical protein
VNSKNNMKVENANVLSESHNFLNRFEAKANSNALGKRLGYQSLILIV